MLDGVFSSSCERLKVGVYDFKNILESLKILILRSHQSSDGRWGIESQIGLQVGKIVSLKLIEHADNDTVVGIEPLAGSEFVEALILELELEVFSI